MKVELSESQCENLADFIEFNLMEVVRHDDDIDNIYWLCDMCDAYRILREAEKGE